MSKNRVILSALETYHNSIIDRICIFYTVPPRSKWHQMTYNCYKITSTLYVPELCVDEEYDEDCTRCDEEYGHDDNWNGNGHGLVCGQPIALCCVCKMKEYIHNTKYGEKRVRD